MLVHFLPTVKPWKYHTKYESIKDASQKKCKNTRAENHPAGCSWIKSIAIGAHEQSKTRNSSVDSGNFRFLHDLIYLALIRNVKTGDTAWAVHLTRHSIGVDASAAKTGHVNAHKSASRICKTSCQYISIMSLVFQDVAGVLLPHPACHMHLAWIVWIGWCCLQNISKYSPKIKFKAPRMSLASSLCQRLNSNKTQVVQGRQTEIEIKDGTIDQPARRVEAV